MKFALFALLCLLSTVAFAGNTDYYTNPNSPGRHYSCDNAFEGKVAYENDRVVFLCGGLVESKTKSFLRGEVTTWRAVDSSKLLVKSAEGVKLSGEQAAAVALDQLQTPFYDSAEKRHVRVLGAGLAMDAIGTAVGLGGGVCSEAGPIAGHLPVLSLAINGYYFYQTRKLAVATPRYFSTSKDFMPYVVGGSHALAGLHNLITCS